MRVYCPPPDKSITIRALLLAAAARGRTVIRNPLLCEDTQAALGCLRALGVKVERGRNFIAVTGGLRAPRLPLEAGSSGALARLLAGLLAGRFDCELRGSPQLNRRPMARVTEPLALLGADIRSKSGRLPLRLGPSALKGAHYRCPVASAQVKSAVLLAGLRAAGKTSFTEPALSRDHTERLLAHFGGRVTRRGLTASLAPGELRARPLAVPGDISSAAPFLAAALLAGVPLKVRGVGLNPTRLGFVRALKKMGAGIELRPKAGGPEPHGDLLLQPAPLRGVRITREEFPSLVDEAPLLALLGAAARGLTVIEGAAELHHKESDRVKTTLALLRAFGAKASYSCGALRVRGPQPLKPGRLSAAGDHRVAMAAAAAAVAAGGARISGASCAAKSYPGFFKDLAEVFG
jgi:3-phosphoshikimate 1-carboxyvinyltransferase